MGDFDACRFDFRLDSKNGLMPSKRKKTERIQPSNYSTLFKCKLCGTLFSCRTSLLEHKLTHTEYRSNRSKYECSVCTGGKALRFSRKDQLREHLSRDHQLDDAQVALLVVGRNPAPGARKTRGANPRKGTEAPPKKPAVKSTSMENSDDRKVSLEAVGTQASNSSLPRLEPNRSQGQSNNQLSLCAPNSASSYLYINFPILISPTSVSDSGDRADRLLPAGIPWPTTPPSTPTSTADPQVNIDAEKVTNSPCGVFFSPNEFASYDLRNTQLRDWIVGRTVNSSGDSGTVRQSPLLFGFGESSACKRELSGSMVLQELAKGLNKNDDQGVLDFSLKARLAPFEILDDSFQSSTYARQLRIDSDTEAADVVDLSWKSGSLPGKSSVPATQGKSGSMEQDGQKNYARHTNDEIETTLSRFREDSGGVNIDSGLSADDGSGVYAGLSARNLKGGVGSSLGIDLISENRSQQRKPSIGPVNASPRSWKTSSMPAVHSSMPQTSFRRAKSGLSKMVEKLWKNKIGQMSNEEGEGDGMISCCKPQSVWMEDPNMEASASAVEQDDRRGNSDEQSPAADHWKCLRDSWTAKSLNELNRIPQNIDYTEEDGVLFIQSSKTVSNQSTYVSRSHFTNDHNEVKSAVEEEEYEDVGTENEIIDLTTSSSTRRSVTPQPTDIVISSPNWNNLEDGASYSKLFRSSSTFPSSSSSYVGSPRGEAPLTVPDDFRDDLEPAQTMPSLYSSNTTLLRTTDQPLSVATRRRCQDYLWEHLLTDRQSRTGYGSPASDPGCISLVSPSHLGSRDDGVTSDAFVCEPDSYRSTTASGSSSPNRHRLSCSFPNCGKTFKEWRHLKVHLTLHTGEKPLGCYLCRYTCRHRSSMNWHMKSKHRLEKSKTSGNRTVYVDTARSGTVLQGAATDPGSVETEDALENTRPFIVEKQSGVLEPERRETCYPLQGTVYLIEPEREVFLTERKNETLLRELRLSLNLLRNNPGAEARHPPPEVLTLMGPGADAEIIQRSTTEDEKPTVVTDQCRSRTSGLVASGCSTSFKERAELPELLLKKITPAPGKDPQFYTSLMRMKYTKHPSNTRRPRRPIKRRPVAQNRDDDVIAVHRCVTCDRVFDSADALWLHGFSEHEAAVRILRCECCGFEAGNSAELQRHLLTTHGQEIGELKDYLCSICGHECSSKTGLSHHLLRHHEDNEVASQFLSCPDLGFGAMASKGTVKHHLRLSDLVATIPPGDVACGVPCPSDGEASLSPLGGSSLISLGQADERPVTCDYPGCDKSFRELKHLKVHQMQHTDEKPLRCHLCEYSCRQRNSMNWHMKSKHGQDKHVTSDGRTIYI